MIFVKKSQHSGKSAFFETRGGVVKGHLEFFPPENHPDWRSEASPSFARLFWNFFLQSVNFESFFYKVYTLKVFFYKVYSLKVFFKKCKLWKLFYKVYILRKCIFYMYRAHRVFSLFLQNPRHFVSKTKKKLFTLTKSFLFYCSLYFAHPLFLLVPFPVHLKSTAQTI